MKPFARLNRFFGRFPLHLAVILMCLLWLLPTLGLFVTSFRTREAVRTSGWWMAFVPKSQTVGQPEYTKYCAACHGADGKKITAADLSKPTLVNQFPSAASLLLMLRKPVNNQPHLLNTPLPTVPTRGPQRTYADHHLHANPLRAGRKHRQTLHQQLRGCDCRL